MISEKVKAELSKYLDNCEKKGMIFVCKRIGTSEGRDYVINRLHEMMLMYPSWQPAQCLSQIEVELNDLANY